MLVLSVKKIRSSAKTIWSNDNLADKSLIKTEKSKAAKTNPWGQADLKLQAGAV